MNLFLLLKIGLHLRCPGALRPDAIEERLDVVRRESLGEGGAR